MALTQVQSGMFTGNNPAIPTSVGVGTQALNSNSGTNNTAVGYQAGYSNTTGVQGTFIGFSAGNKSTGSYSTYIGSSAGIVATTGTNTFVGYAAGFNVTTGTANTFIGPGVSTGSGGLITTGSKNTIIGEYSGNQGGLDIRTASNNIVLSDGDGNPRLYHQTIGGTYVWYNTPVANAAHQVLDPNGAGAYLITNHPSGAGSGYSYHIFTYNGTTIGQINQNGTTAITYATTSDYRLKENIAPLTGALATVAQLKPVTYKWKSDGSDGQGFIAHELQAVVPDCVTGEKDAVDEDGKPVYQGIDTSFLVATLTAAIQELNAKVTALETQLATK